MSDKKIIKTDLAPKAISSYSQAVAYGGLLYCSGQIPLNPETMEVVGSTTAEQTKQVMENMKEVLKAAGTDHSKVIKCNVYLQNMGDFAEFNEVYSHYFSENPPARSTVEVAKLPKNVLVEIECIAHL